MNRLIWQHKSNKLFSIILLAAGTSRRMGQPKQLLAIGETSLIRHSLQKCLTVAPKRVVVVTGAYAESIEAHIADLPIIISRNEAWKEGMGTSLARGMSSLLAHFPDTQAVLLLVCDQPFLSVKVLEDLIRLYKNSKASIVAANYGTAYGVPALFDKKWFGILAQLKGDEGAKKVMKNHLDEIKLVDFPKGKIDLDTLEDYEKYCFK